MTSVDPVESTSLTSSPAEGVLVQTDSKGRLRVSKEQRKAVLAKFEQSGMSAAKFAAVAGMKYSTFAGWVQRYRRAKPTAALRRLRLLEAVVDPAILRRGPPSMSSACICRGRFGSSCPLWPKCR